MSKNKILYNSKNKGECACLVNQPVFYDEQENGLG